MPSKYEKKHPDKKLGRKLKEIDVVLLEKLTKLQLSDKIISSIVGCHEDTLHKHFSDQMDVWRSMSKGKIADVLYDEALNKREPWALKTIAQRHLGYHDKVTVDNTSSDGSFKSFTDVVAQAYARRNEKTEDETES